MIYIVKIDDSTPKGKEIMNLVKHTKSAEVIENIQDSSMLTEHNALTDEYIDAHPEEFSSFKESFLGNILEPAEKQYGVTFKKTRKSLNSL